ncbi:MAG: hypothetical protein KDD58_02605 [Bdellovibrionales bacterium]|nr:hypothetical protein [Bdellovibrionales bacterium]
MLLGDFHIHTNFSDGRLSIPEVIDYYGMRGFDVISITDHLCDNQSLCGMAANYLDKTLTQKTWNLYLETLQAEAERAWFQYRLLVLPGVELTKNSLINSRSAHVLAINVENYINPLQDPYDLAIDIHKQDGLCIAAHPVWTRKVEPQTYHLWDNRWELASVIDAWEVASGPHMFDEVLTSGLPLIANSDFHHPHHMRSWKTLLDCKKNPADILEAIRKQRIKFVFYENTQENEYQKQIYA